MGLSGEPAGFGQTGVALARETLKLRLAGLAKLTNQRLNLGSLRLARQTYALPLLSPV